MKTILTTLFFLIYTIIFSQSDSVKNYYKKIVFGNEFNSKDTTGEYRWKTDVKLFVVGEKSTEMTYELNRVVSELNTLINTIEIKVVDTQSEANVTIIFGSKQDYINYDRSVEPYVKFNEGLFSVSNKGKELYQGSMYVNVRGNLTLNEKKHLLREELTQLLGLFNDSYLYKNSIFYQGWTSTTEYSQIDRELIKMLYNK